MYAIRSYYVETIEAEGEPKTQFDILSPITGTVTKRQVAIGDYVKEGSARITSYNVCYTKLLRICCSVKSHSFNLVRAAL